MPQACQEEATNRATPLAAMLLATGLAGTARADEYSVTNQGEQAEVHYPAGYTGNIVGGGEMAGARA